MRRFLKSFLLIASMCFCFSATAQVSKSEHTADAGAPSELDANTVLVFPIEALSVAPRAEELATTTYEALISRLREVSGLNVIGDDAVAPFLDAGMSPEAIARQLGAGHYVTGDSTVRVPHHWIKIAFRSLSGPGGWVSSSWIDFIDSEREAILADGGAKPEVLFERFMQRITASILETIYPDIVPDAQQAAVQAEQDLFDTTLDDKRRLDALKEIVGNRGFPPGSDAERREWITNRLAGSPALTAAQLARESDDEYVRYMTWNLLSQVDDPALIGPLLQTLTTDASGLVRTQAVRNLKYFLDEPGVRQALEAAGDADPFDFARNEVQLVLLSGDHLRDYLHGLVLDRTKPEIWRTRAFNEFATEYTLSSPTGHELVAAMAEIGRNSDDGRIREHIWGQLTLRAPRDEHRAILLQIREALIDSARLDSNERVRDSALRQLKSLIGEPDVLATIEQALANDPSPLVRRTAENIIQSRSPQ